MTNEYADSLLTQNLSTAEKLINAFRAHIGDDDDRNGYEFQASELYLFLRDADRLLNALNVTTNLTFSDIKISISGTITKSIAILLIFAGDYLLWRRLEREGTRGAISLREMDSAIDTRQIARSASDAVRSRWEQLNDVISEYNGGIIKPWRINNFIRNYFPASDQTRVDQTGDGNAQRV